MTAILCKEELARPVSTIEYEGIINSNRRGKGENPDAGTAPALPRLSQKRCKNQICFVVDMMYRNGNGGGDGCG
jgi:hypothetical protein